MLRKQGDTGGMDTHHPDLFHGSCGVKCGRRPWQCGTFNRKKGNTNTARGDSGTSFALRSREQGIDARNEQRAGQERGWPALLPVQGWRIASCSNHLVVSRGSLRKAQSVFIGEGVRDIRSRRGVERTIRLFALRSGILRAPSPHQDQQLSHTALVPKNSCRQGPFFCPRRALGRMNCTLVS